MAAAAAVLAAAAAVVVVAAAVVAVAASAAVAAAAVADAAAATKPLLLRKQTCFSTKALFGEERLSNLFAKNPDKAIVACTGFANLRTTFFERR